MQRINTANARPDANGSGKPGFSYNDDLEGVDPTNLSPEFMNALQEEICGVIEGFDIELNSNDKGQLLKALIKAFARKNGSILETFSVAPAAQPHHSLRRDQLLSSMPNDIKIFLLRLQYPIGTPYFNKVDDRNPNEIFGVAVGTWVREQGRFMVGLQEGDPTFGTAAATGGSKTVTLSSDNMPAHVHNVPAQTTTTSTEGSHDHSITIKLLTAAGGDTTGLIGGVGNAPITPNTTPAGSHNHSVTIPAQNTSSVGGGQSFSILPPFVVYHWWVRTE